MYPYPQALPDHHGDLVEAPVPLRFLFLQIGPSDDTVDYHEVGRAMATLMSDAVRQYAVPCINV